MTNTELNVSIATLAVKHNIKFFEKLKQGFKRKVAWNKHRSEITTQTKNKILDDMTHRTFKNTNRLFVLLFKTCNDDPARKSFVKYYMPTIEIKGLIYLLTISHFFTSQ